MIQHGAGTAAVWIVRENAQHHREVLNPVNELGDGTNAVAFHLVAKHAQMCSCIEFEAWLCKVKKWHLLDQSDFWGMSAYLCLLVCPKWLEPQHFSCFAGHLRIL